MATNRRMRPKCWTIATLRHWLRIVTNCYIKTYGSVWESNPQRALFKPATGFEDQGPHQRCKHSRNPEKTRKPRIFSRSVHCKASPLVSPLEATKVHFRPLENAKPDAKTDCLPSVPVAAKDWLTSPERSGRTARASASCSLSV